MRIFRRCMVLLFLVTVIAFGLTFMNERIRKDHTPPVIKSDGDLKLSVKDEQKALLKGLTASDNRDGDLTDKILIGNRTNFTDKKGSFEQTYMVYDSNQNMGLLERKVTYTDYSSPTIDLRDQLVFVRNEQTDILSRITANDVLEGDITSKVRLTSSDVDATKYGTYSIGLSVTNDYGDSTDVELPVHVLAKNRNDMKLQLNKWILFRDSDDESELNYESYIKDVFDDGGEPIPEAKEQVQISHDSVKLHKPGVYEAIYTYTLPYYAEAAAKLKGELTEEQEAIIEENSAKSYLIVVVRDK